MVRLEHWHSRSLKPGRESNMTARQRLKSAIDNDQKVSRTQLDQEQGRTRGSRLPSGFRSTSFSCHLYYSNSAESGPSICHGIFLSSSIHDFDRIKDRGYSEAQDHSQTVD